MSNDTVLTDDDPPVGWREGYSRRAVLGGGVAALSGMAGCANVVVGKRDESESTYDLSSGVLRVDATYGDVRVRPHDADAVRVHVEKRGSLFTSIEAVEVTSRRDGDAVVVESRSSKGSLSNPPNVTIRVDLPEGVAVASMRGRNGDVSIRDVPVADGLSVVTNNGDADLRGVDGPITLVGSSAGVEVATGNGDAAVENVAGYVTGHSNNGDVEIRRCLGIDGASTTNGDVDVDVTGLRQDAQVTTTNGDVTAAFAKDLDASVTARTTNGDVRVKSVPTTRETGRLVEGSFGEGTHDLRIVTTNGDIQLERFTGVAAGG